MKLTDTPVAGQALLQEAVRRILAAGSPRKIVLFGSRARGSERLDSDLDLLIVEDRSDLPRYKRSTPYLVALLGLDANIDIAVWTPDEISDWAAVPQAFITTVLREGKVLHERAG